MSPFLQYEHHRPFYDKLFFQGIFEKDYEFNFDVYIEFDTKLGLRFDKNSSHTLTFEFHFKTYLTLTLYFDFVHNFLFLVQLAPMQTLAYIDKYLN